MWASASGCGHPLANVLAAERTAGTAASEWVQADEVRLPGFLCPKPFTLPELQRVYEIVLGRELEKSALRKRMLDTIAARLPKRQDRVEIGRPRSSWR